MGHLISNEQGLVNSHTMERGKHCVHRTCGDCLDCMDAVRKVKSARNKKYI